MGNLLAMMTNLLNFQLLIYLFRNIEAQLVISNYHLLYFNKDQLKKKV